jgi:hypothetical protein
MIANQNLRKTSLTSGILYLLTFVSIPTLSLYGPIHDADYLTRPGSDTPVVLGSILEIIVALAGIGSSVVLYPVLKKQNRSVALGLVASRVLEAGTIFAGTAFLLTIVSLHRSGTGADAKLIAQTLVTLYDRIFIAGQSLLPAVNDLLLGYLLYKSCLVPRWLALTGIIGAFPLIAGNIAMQFDVIGRQSALAGLSAIGVAVFESGLGLYLTFRGYKPSGLNTTFEADQNQAYGKDPSQEHGLQKYAPGENRQAHDPST